MRIVHLRKPVAPNGDGFYEVGPQGFGAGPFSGEAARVRFARLLADGVAVWTHDAAALRGAEDEAQLKNLMDEAEAEVGPTECITGAGAALAATIRCATIIPATDRPSGPMP